MKFRYHRGSLASSMETLQDFDIEKICCKGEKVQLHYYGYDDRIGRDLWIVTKKDDENNFYPIGFLQKD